MTLEEQRSRGDMARELLQHPMMEEALADIERAYFDAWKATPARDKDGKEELWKLTKTLEKFKQHLKTTLETGKMATIQLEKQKRFGVW